jgi:hypothetical protein
MQTTMPCHATSDFTEIYLTEFLVSLWSQRAHTSLEEDLLVLSEIDVPESSLLHEALFNMCKTKIDS